MTALPFTKMHGLGNDFVVLDARAAPVRIDDVRARAIADRRRGVGCDQLLVMEPPSEGLADVFMRIRNADGSEVSACGNGSRCVAHLMMEETGEPHAVIQTVAGLLDAEAAPGGAVSIDMGRAQLDWREIPLAEAADTLHLDVGAGPLKDACCVGMGNPHAVYFVDNAESVPLDTLGPAIETHGMFPEFTNVEVVQVLAPDRLRMRVWERGAGITLACGSGACAAVVAAYRRGLTGRRCEVVLDGGPLTIEWLTDGNVVMTGPVAKSFSGVLNSSLLD